MSMALSSAKAHSLPHLEEDEVALLDLAAANDARDSVVPLSDKEALILQLYHRTQEQKVGESASRTRYVDFLSHQDYLD